jgi:hypothetical protein
MHSTDEWIGVREQIIVEREGGFDNDYSKWLTQFDGDHEQSTLEQKYGAVTRPESEVPPVRDPKTREFVWGIRELGKVR